MTDTKWRDLPLPEHRPGSGNPALIPVRGIWLDRPQRIQRKRTKGYRMPEGAVHVARPSRWGNLWSIGGMAHIETCPSTTGPVCFTVTRESAVELFRIYVEARVLFEHGWLDPLRGRDLACWCPLEDAEGRRVPCHADVLLELANR